MNEASTSYSRLGFHIISHNSHLNLLQHQGDVNWRGGDVNWKGGDVNWKGGDVNWKG
jgi:hypothetical protein